MSDNTLEYDEIVQTLDNKLAGSELTPIPTRWIKKVEADIGQVPDQVEALLRQQAEVGNYLKPIGLYLGDDELLRTADEGFFQPSGVERKKVNSLIESFWYHGRKRPCEKEETPMSRTVLVPATAEVVDAAAVPNPPNRSASEGLEGYVDERFDWQLDELNPGLIKDRLKKHP